MLTTTVILDIDVEGFHRYPAAPEEVSFLRSSHRHLFRIQVEYEVEAVDREREIFIEEARVKRWLHKRFGSPCRFDDRSCEMIAHEILRAFDACSVRVLEDGRGGACVRRSSETSSHPPAAPRAEALHSDRWPEPHEPSAPKARQVAVRLPLDLEKIMRHTADIARTYKLFALGVEEWGLMLRLAKVRYEINQTQAEARVEAYTRTHAQ